MGALDKKPKMKLSAKWTDDCQGKKDYDGKILSISTRYWPRGGGFSVFDHDNPQLGMQGNETRPDVKPSASSSLTIWYLDEDDCEQTLDLVKAEFTGETFKEIKPQVEKWAQKQMDCALKAFYTEFPTSKVMPAKYPRELLDRLCDAGEITERQRTRLMAEVKEV